MALEIKSFSAVQEASGNLNSAATKYAEELEGLKTIISTISWEGTDAAAYKQRVESAISQLNGIKDSLASQSAHLNSVVTVISEAQQRIASKLS